jgi:hypothetical protein
MPSPFGSACADPAARFIVDIWLIFSFRTCATPLVEGDHLLF